MKILVSGLAGTGKDSIAEILSREFNLKRYSSGGIMREAALKEFSHIKNEEKRLVVFENSLNIKSEYGIDKLIDEKTLKLLQGEDNFILDSRLGWYFAKKIKNCNFLNIVLFASPDIRYKRLSISRNITFEAAKKLTLDRESSIEKRFSDLYKLDILELSNPKNFDIFIDTSDLNLEEVYKKIFDFIRSKK